MANSPLFLLLRGPLLVIAVIVALFYPTLSQISVETWVRISILLVGLALSVFDCLVVIKEWVRSSLRRYGRSIVLDDVLRALFDKDGLIASIMSTVIGNATMYSFGNHQQRVRLVGSCLETSETDADTILTTPGGVLRVLPESVQNWLDEPCEVDTETKGNEQDEEAKPPVKKQPRNLPERLHVEAECDTSSYDSDDETYAARNLSDSLEFKDTSDNSRPEETLPRSQPQRVERDAIPSSMSSSPPEELVVTIFKEIISDGIKNAFQTIPDHYIKCIGIAASTALTVQLRSSPTARRVTMGLLQGSTAVGLAGVAVGAMAAFVTKHSYGAEQSRSSIEERSRPELLLDLVKRAPAAFRRVTQRPEFAQWRGALALLILSFVGRIKKRLLPTQSHLS